MSKSLNEIMKWYMQYRYRHIDYFIQYPFEAQRNVLSKLLIDGAKTSWGQQYNLSSIKDYKDFNQKVPLQNYESLHPYIHAMMMGKKNVLTKKKVKWFAKSSGTTLNTAKYIPVPKVNLKENHLGGSKDVLAILFNQFPDLEIFKKKNLVMGGALQNISFNKKAKTGDISAFILENMPSVAYVFYAPDIDIALMSDWEKKLEKMARILIKEDMAMIAGVPTWTLVLIKKILALTGAKNILEVWPNLQVYVHGGVNFTPYRPLFKALIPRDDFIYIETYNASEGFFGIQNDFSTDDLLLLLDNYVFYEFIPMASFNGTKSIALPLWDVEVGVDYALVISTNAGLWRYIIGDTVRFTNISPYKIKITGRTTQFINIFGEEVVISNVEYALAQTCRLFEVQPIEYTVGPVFMSNKNKGGHEWLIEFEEPPKDLAKFEKSLDKNLQKINSDYAAKRTKDLALERLKIKVMPKGKFAQWLKSKNKWGGQNKVPRLKNDRSLIEEILAL